MRSSLTCALLACLLLTGVDAPAAAPPTTPKPAAPTSVPAPPAPATPALSHEQQAIQQLVEHPHAGSEPASPNIAVEPSRLRALYVKRNFQPLWTREGQPTPQALALIEALRAAEEHGLRSADYDPEALAALLKTPGSSADAGRIAVFDTGLSRTAMRFLTHLHQGRIDARAAGFELSARDGLDHGALLELLATSSAIAPVLGSVEPPFNHYQLLKATLQRYRALAAQPGLTRLPQPGRLPIKPGEAYAGAPRLRTLLHALGDLPTASGPKAAAKGANAAAPTLDPPLVKGIKRFQLRHGLTPNGALDAPTYAALTTPLAQRVRQIELTLERWRWLPPFETPPLVVNIPQFRLFAFRSTQDRKEDILQMDVIVGQSFPEKQTPVFAGDIRFLIFRPYWEVPRDIIQNEMLPNVRKDPQWVAAHHLQLVQAEVPDDQLTPLPVTPENVDALEAGTLRLRQEPGPDNSLGLIKFMFPNAHGVYLHSTAAHDLFKKSRRDFSHGCIRVSDPVGLAVHLLRDTPGDWTREKVEAAMKSGDNQRVDLAKPIRVYILYGSAMANQDGTVQFFDDIYGHDHALETLLQLPPLIPPARTAAGAGQPPAAAAAGTAAAAR